ncbi:DNA repair protein RecN [Mediannikoviicoccus vaginalis]|uniref:DNA repair protein RecN n=1 Tax=Mediannikoviicoccus vaginalis TaxID=2899727 RepID=UPI001F006E53|nr:DNA repair protein RecN [Mediannikoviicoccus vaginalis]
MLAELYIQNFVIIEKLQVEFDPFFNVITGETGAGKTILVNALKLLIGDRFQKSYIGQYGNTSIVEGKFLISSEEKLNRFKEMGYELEDGVLIVTRESKSEGTSNNRINGRNVTLSFLKEMMQDLIDIHSQNENQTLLNKSNYISILDAFSPNGNKKILEDLNKNLKELQSLRSELSSLSLSSEEIDREKDILRFQIEELESIDLENFNEEEIENEFKVLSNVDRIKVSIAEISESLKANDFGKFEVLGSLSEIVNELSELKELDLELKEVFDRIESSYYELEDVYRDIESYQDHLYYDEERLQLLDDTIANITSLKRKYGSDISDLIDFRESSKERLNALEKIEENIERLNKEINKKYLDCKKLCDILTDIRKKVSKKLEKDILENIKGLNMPNAKFSIDFYEDEKITSTGNDIIEFNISTNVGQPLMPLNKVASGGELSRIMLALKTSLASIDNVDTLIFDEVDTGISGRTAILVGEKLQKISKSRQIITISHLAQIASLASSHKLIEKSERDVDTISNIRTIDDKERVMEISRLIGGINITENTINQAIDMIEQGRFQFNEEEK